MKLSIFSLGLAMILGHATLCLADPPRTALDAGPAATVERGRPKRRAGTRSQPFLRPIPGRLREPPVRDTDRVLVVRNENSPISKAVADDYARGERYGTSFPCDARIVPRTQGMRPFPRGLEQTIEKPIRTFVVTHVNIDFIILTKGIPIRIADARGEAG